MKKIVDLAVIIPTLNEQYYIGELLDSLYKQTIQPKEIIVVDAQSTDKTEEQVRKRMENYPSLSFYVIAKKTIAKQRNFGAKKSTAAHLLFLDADMLLLEKDTLKKFWTKIQTNQPDVATCYVMPLSDEMIDKFLYGTGNVIYSVMRPIKPMGTTMNLYVKRSVFFALDGFSEKVRVAEDFEFVSRVAKAAYSFHVYMRPIFNTSIRRLKYEGRAKFIAKLLRSIIYIQRYGHAKNPIPYDFGQFHEKV